MAKLRRFGATPVAEGVRLEVGKYTVFAVRNAQKDIAVRMRREPRKLLRACMSVPFVRGAARLVRDVLRFFDGLAESAELNPQRPVRGTAPERAIARLLHIRPQTLATLLSAILIVPIALACLFAAPAGAELLLRRYYPLPRLWLNLAVAAVRVAGLFAAVGLTCRLRVFRRLCMYQGAVNRVLNCYESREDVNAESAAAHPIFARRSEAAFLLCALAVSLFLFPLIHPMHPALAALARLGVLLGVAALINEPMSALEEARPTLAVRALRAPLYLLQHMTTLEPHPQMMEVAVCAFDAAMGRSKAETEAEVISDDDIGVDDQVD